jgi:hypothetical protein
MKTAPDGSLMFSDGVKVSNAITDGIESGSVVARFDKCEGKYRTKSSA